MMALSIRQPWAWLIIHGGKDIENRDWPTQKRGRILVHAGKGMTRADYDDACAFAYRCGLNNNLIPLPEDLPRGGIVGSIEIVNCVERSPSPWFQGRYGFVLRRPQGLPFTPWRGQLGFFPVPLDSFPRVAPT